MAKKDILMTGIGITWLLPSKRGPLEKKMDDKEVPEEQRDRFYNELGSKERTIKNFYRSIVVSEAEKKGLLITEKPDKKTKKAYDKIAKNISVVVDFPNGILRLVIDGTTQIATQ